MRSNVAWGPRLRGEPVNTSRLEELLRRLGLEGFGDRDARDLSGGEAQRVALARTLFNEPGVLLLDEIASSLDAGAARQVETLVQDVMEAYALTAILVTHDAGRARRLGTCGLRLEDGVITRRGAVGDILDTRPTAPTER